MRLDFSFHNQQANKFLHSINTYIDSNTVLNLNPMANSNPVTNSTPIVDSNPIAHTDAIFNANPMLNATPIFDSNAIFNATPMFGASAVFNTSPIFNEPTIKKENKPNINNKEKEFAEQQKSIILKMMEKDLAIPKSVDKEHIADLIVKHSQQAKLDPVVIAAIAQQETHFTQNVPVKNGSGIMQLTTITIEDMFLRPHRYGETIKPILKKYKTAKNLMKAVRKDPDLNIHLGSLVFKDKLNVAKGNRLKALRLYNGSKYKNQYAISVNQKIANANKLSQSLNLLA